MDKLSAWINRLIGGDDLANKTHKIIPNQSIYKDGAERLESEGSGTVCINLKELKAFNIDLIASNALLRLCVSHQNIKLYCIYRGRFILLKEDHTDCLSLESNTKCSYWLSFESHTRSIIFGKHYPRIENSCFSFNLPKSNKSTEQYWMNKINHYRIDTAATVYLLQEPVTQAAIPKARLNLLATGS